MKKVSVLGSTGSVGTQTLKVCQTLGYTVTALTAGKNTEMLERQAREFSPAVVAVADKTAYNDLKTRLSDTPVRVLAGEEGVCEAAALNTTDIVCNAVVGIAGLRPTLAAIGAKKTLALSNKETLVAGGQLVLEAATQQGVDILPVDSEHSAIFQCLQGNDKNTLKKIFLTASGGPFRGKTAQELESVSLTDALAHPNWQMGAKITVDSATLMNKGLELIEAMYFFGLPPEQIEVVVHPQSVVHSAVEYTDGSVIAQLGVPDMAIPIQYALTWPQRAPSQVRRLSLFDYPALTFERPQSDTFVCLRHCIEAARRGGLYPCAVNGANEQAVALFLEEKIGFADIGRCVGHVLESIALESKQRYNLNDVFETDFAARTLVREYCAGMQE